MAFEQNYVSRDLHQLNLARTIPQETQIVPMITSGMNIEGLSGKPNCDVVTSGPIPVYYPAMVPGAGYVGLGYGNGVPSVAAWTPPMPKAMDASAGIDSAMKYCYNPNFGGQMGGEASDIGSSEGGEDSVSGRKIKLLCSFGGKILPRPGDGLLRYVGGETRIIAVGRYIGFSELVQKMVNTCRQNVVIKYQLPEGDLDALVSVSCPDDLENMMDEYDKLVEKSSEGSDKLRIFLFTASELDSSSFMLLGGVQDVANRYVEAVNGISDVGGYGITRKGSTGSAASTQNSDLSGIELPDSLVNAQRDVAWPLSDGVSYAGGNSGITRDVSPKFVPVDPMRAVRTGGSAAAAAPLGVSMFRYGLPQMLPTQPDYELERFVPVNLQQPQVGMVPLPSHSLQAYVNPHQEATNRAEYMQHIGFQTQPLGTIRPMFTPPQFPDNTSYVQHQFVPVQSRAMMTPSSHVSTKPNLVVPSVQPPQVGPRILQLQSDFQPAAVGHLYGLHQVSLPEEVGRSDGWVPHQQVTVPEKFRDCHMCQKALAHAHSDSLVPGDLESPTSMISDLNSAFHSLRLEDNMRAQPIIAGTKVFREGLVGQRVGAQATSGVESSYGVFATNPSQQIEGNVIKNLAMPMHFQVNQGALIQPVASDFAPLGAFPPRNSDCLLHEQPIVYSGELPGLAPAEDTIRPCVTYTNLRPMNGKMENLQQHTPDAYPGSEWNYSPSEPTKEDDAGNRTLLDTCVGNASSSPNNKPPCSSSEASYLPLLGNPLSYSHSKIGFDHLAPINHSYVTSDESLPISEVSSYPKVFQPNVGSSDSESVHLNGFPPSFLSPPTTVGVLEDSSNSLFSEQDPWSWQHDNHPPAPWLDELPTQKEISLAVNLSGENRLGDSRSTTRTSGEFVTDGHEEDDVYQPSSSKYTKIGPQYVKSSKGSTEEVIKKELQEVAEGVAVSVLQSSTPPNPNLSPHGSAEYLSTDNQGSEIQKNNVGLRRDLNNEELKSKMIEKINLGFPASEDIGRLQIIRNIDLEELRELGTGTFGTVYHGKWRGSDVAIKRINNRCFAGGSSEQERLRNDFWNEAINLADLHHPNVVAFYGIVLDGPGGSVATVTEFMVNGSLRNALQKYDRTLDKRKRLLIATDVAFGMEYLHGKNIVHFDLKSDNLLVNLRDPHRPICKVGDLGLSKVKCQTLISGGVRGTLPWMAPELLNGSSSLVSEKVDVFSFGIVMWELLTGEEPYEDLHYGAIIGGIVSNTLRPPVPKWCDPEWRSLMERCWSPEPSKRPCFTTIAKQLRSMAAKIPPKGQR